MKVVLAVGLICISACRPSQNITETSNLTDRLASASVRKTARALATFLSIRGKSTMILAVSPTSVSLSSALGGKESLTLQWNDSSFDRLAIPRELRPYLDIDETEELRGATAMILLMLDSPVSVVEYLVDASWSDNSFDLVCCRRVKINRGYGYLEPLRTFER